ncbi:FtsX-like permease family protein [Sediminicoccus rosea]|jgi:putative ABC transport system permease protein|uniref:FtsX-like permease family protein n=1 Tax=Sediminicoccus rosea TaxID=1225128 RepID=A0ABZ0PIX5_9PROT|nr:FtsX-like permease family protein [Sediminicoccus rosea]WPB85406.1 FtsX-like permease family protein [Sediminicoccus rosea]
MMRWRLVLRLALRDLLHERRLAVCSFIGLAAVLLPLLLLFALKHGVMQGLREELIENPRSRMVVNQANRAFPESFLEQLSARPDVAFAIGRIRSLNADARFLTAARPNEPTLAELWATGPGDPLLGEARPRETRDVVFTRALAARSGAEPGEAVTLRAIRVNADGRREVLNLPLRLIGVAPAAALDRPAAFVEMRVLRLVDGFLNGELPATIAPEAIPPRATTPYAGFRAHARRLEDVPRLDAELRAAGVDVETRAVEVASLLQLDRSLALLFALIAGLGGAGYLLSLAVGLYANVERKQRQLSQLRLLGLRRGEVVLLPLIQALVVGVVGTMLAALVALGAAQLINGLNLAGAGPRAVAVIRPWHLLVALCVTLLGAALAAGFAARRAGRVVPAEGIRDG